ncbi:MAG: NUDIX hydrolase [Ectothiorhodospiraceae bacterium]|jgi:8-oxo-dGTP pyrophosphatase MutT (NUDIX family)
MADSEEVWKPHVTVAAVVEREGRFLLVEETSSGRVVLNQPAGHLEPGESLSDAVVRETLEEAALDIEPQSLVGIYRWEHPTKPKTFLRVAFAARILRRHPDRELDDGIHRTLWLNPEEIAEQARRLRSPLVQRSVMDYLSGHRYPLELLQEV